MEPCTDAPLNFVNIKYEIISNHSHQLWLSCVKIQIFSKLAESLQVDRIVHETFVLKLNI